MEHSKDHDLLIEIKTEMKNLKEEVRLMRDNSKDQIKELQIGKLDTRDFNDFKLINTEAINTVRINYTSSINKLDESIAGLQTRMSYIIGAVAVLSFIAPYIINYFLK